MRSALLALPALLCLSFPAAAQSPSAKPPAEQQAPPQAAPSPSASAPAPRRDDVKSIDSILAALYGVISGPSGQRDWERFLTLFLLLGCLTSPTKNRVCSFQIPP